MLASHPSFSQLNTTISRSSPYIHHSSHFTCGCAPKCHMQRQKGAARSSAQLSAVAATSSCQVQFIWCDGTCLETCCVFSEFFFLILTPNWQSWNRMASNSFSVLQSLRYSLCFFSYSWKWKRVNYASLSHKGLLSPSSQAFRLKAVTHRQAEEFPDSMKVNKAVREVAEQGPCKLSGKRQHDGVVLGKTE